MAESKPNPLVLEAVTVEDVPDIVELWFAAFQQPIITTLWPNTPGMHDWWRDWHLSNLKKANFKYLKVVDTDSKDANGKPRLIAFGVWDTSMAEDRGVRFPPWHPDSDPKGCDLLLETLEAERKRVMGTQKHYCRVFLSITPPPSHLSYYRHSACCTKLNT